MQFSEVAEYIIETMRIKWKFVVFLISFILATFFYIHIYAIEKPKDASALHQEHPLYHELKNPHPQILEARKKADDAITKSRVGLIKQLNIQNGTGYSKLTIPAQMQRRGVGSAYEGRGPLMNWTYNAPLPPYDHPQNVKAGKLLHQLMTVETYHQRTAVSGEYDSQTVQNMGPIPYLPNYKNPCWYERDHVHHTVALKCLPYALILGFQKAGTTELHNKLSLHPQVRAPDLKEPFFWGLNEHSKTLDQYTNIFSKAEYDIFSTIKVEGDTWTHPLVTFEATPSTLFKIPTKKESSLRVRNATEPYHHALKDLKKMLPNAKLIVSMRNPVDRAYSEFMRLGFNSTRRFHQLMQDGVKEFKRCLQKHSLRSCVYWPEEAYTGKISQETLWSISTVGFSIYHVPMEELLEVFPHKQVFYFRLEDYTKSKVGTLQRLFKFLELDPLDDDTKAKMRDDPNPNPRDYTLGPMQPQTRKLLSDFYAPYNKKLAQMLGTFTLQWSKFS